MSSTPQTRRSGRASAASKRYTVDPFKEIGVNLYASSDSGSSTTSVEDADEAEDEEFDSDAAEEAEAIEVDVGPSSEDSEDGDASDASTDGQEEEDGDDDESIIGTETASVSATPRPKRIIRFPKDISRGRSNLFAVQGTNQQPSPWQKKSSRGIFELDRHAAKDARYRYYFGPSDEDLIPTIFARNKWASQWTLPSRRENQDEVGGFHHSYYYTDEYRRRETTVGWEWYYKKGGQNSFNKHQPTQEMDYEQFINYVHKPTESDHTILIGPIDSPEVINLHYGEWLNVKKVFSKHEENENDHSSQIDEQGARHGWVLSLGSRVHCLEWVPNNPTSNQYLSISVLPKDYYMRRDSEGESIINSNAPSFLPAPASPSSIQIWRFRALDGNDDQSRMDTGTDPSLELVLCFDWGPPKQLRWCPMATRDHKVEKTGDPVHLGLVAGVWADGCVRVLDIRYTPKAGTPTSLYIKKAAFSTRAPHTVCTTVCWLSSSGIAAGCANGYVAVWDIAQQLSSSIPDSPSPQKQPSDPRPILYIQSQPTFVYNILSGYPSRPYLISTTSPSGFVHLIDLRSPTTDNHAAPRSRMGRIPLAWHEAVQSFLSTGEDCMLRAAPVRRFYHMNLLGKLEAQVTTLATSPVHPFILIGTAAGAIWGTNGAFRRAVDQKARTWVQPWFVAEWRRPLPEEDIKKQKEQAGSELQENEGLEQMEAIWRKPMTRFLDGLIPQRIGQLEFGAKEEEREKGEEEAQILTIYEEPSAITAAAWNPNVRVGGWAAAGTGSGLVRVEDICFD